MDVPISYPLLDNRELKCMILQSWRKVTARVAILAVKRQKRILVRAKACTDSLAALMAVHAFVYP